MTLALGARDNVPDPRLPPEPGDPMPDPVPPPPYPIDPDPYPRYEDVPPVDPVDTHPVPLGTGAAPGDSATAVASDAIAAETIAPPSSHRRRGVLN
jgi:hypothetical protein